MPINMDIPLMNSRSHFDSRPCSAPFFVRRILQRKKIVADEQIGRNIARILSERGGSTDFRQVIKY